MSSLEHYGIKGQKWGVRRFQNPDGTRTEAGKKRTSDNRSRRRALINSGKPSLDQRLLSNGGSYINNASKLSTKGHGDITDADKFSSVMSKGSVVNRFATKDEPLDSHRKYVSFTEKDKEIYEQTIKGHGLQAKWDSLDDLLLYSYETTKDLKIANGRKIESYIVNDLKTRSNYKISSYAKDQVKAISHHVDNAYIFEGYLKQKENGEWAKKSTEDRRADYKIVCKAISENSIYSDTLKFYMTGFGTNAFDKMSDALRKDGYDALVDMFDARSINQPTYDQGGLADYPIAILDPKSSLKLKKTIKLNHSSIGGNMNYIYGNTLVLGDSSYLEHHGIKGQRWGVRRFQNKDGSLTNAGRKRLGYSTKDVKSAVIKGGKAVGGAVATVGKTGYKLGKKAVVAAKARSDRKKAEKLEKKKAELEKKKAEAAKTRLGVVKNADLFTVAEMAELNKKFKAKDEMTLASLQKGADYFRLAAGMVGAVSSINKDFESMTGKSLIPNPVKKEKEKREADERAEDRARKLAKEDAEEDRKRRADERKSRADDIDFKNKAEDLKNKKSEELRKQAAESRAQAKQTWDEAQAAEKTRAMKGVADENEAKAAIKRQELKTNEIAQREEAVAKREAAAEESEERINYARKEVLKRIDDADTYRDALRKATDMLRNAHDLTREQQDEVWAFIKKAQEDKLGHDGMDGSYLEHHGIKGQRWGVRRFQNPDGTLTDKGRKHYQKKLDREKRKQVSSDAMRGTLERQHGLAVGASGIITGVAGALSVAAVASNPVTIAAGAAIAAAVSSGITHGSYSIAEAWEGRGSRIRKKKIAKYENMLKQDGFIVEDGTLYLEHFGIKNMKWGVRRFQNKDGSLTEAGKKRYGSGKDEELSSGGGGGGAPEEDEEMKKKIEEAAKKAGMTVDEYRKKYANVIANMKQAAKNVNKTAKNVKEDVSLAAEDAVDAVTGKQSKRLAEGWAKNAQKHDKQAQEEKEKYISESRKRGGGDNSVKDDHRLEASRHEDEAKKAHDASNYWRQKYDKSLGGRYEKLKATMAERGKAKKKEAGEGMGSKLYDTFGGKYKKEAETQRNRANTFNNEAQKYSREYNKQKATQASESRKADKAETSGDFHKHVNSMNVAKVSAKTSYRRKTEAENARLHSVIDANKAQDKYEKSLAGRYDKFKADRERKDRMKRDKMIEDAFRKETPERTHVLPKMKSATAKPMRRLTSKELSKIRSEARIKQLKKDGDYTGEYKKKRRK